MKSKSLWLGLSILLVAAMVLSSCNKSTTTSTTTTTTSSAVTTKTTSTTTAVTTTSNTTTTSTTAAATTPKYGGSLTILTNWYTSTPDGFNSLSNRQWEASLWTNPFLEWLVRADIEKFGPKGTNDYNFGTWEEVPNAYIGPELAESWEIKVGPPMTYTFHLRKGVMWTGNPAIGMAPRELTSDDVVYTYTRTKATAPQNGYIIFIDSCTAPDKYTAVWNCKYYDANWFFNAGGGMSMGAIVAKESVTSADPASFKNAVGTGPFIVTDYVTGSMATYTRNPNYWGKTTVNGKEYQMPFIDKLYYPVIPDESTAIAALRTAKIDWWPNVRNQFGATLTSSSPDMIQKPYPGGSCDIVRFNRINSKYFQDKNIRRAMMIGTDLNTVAKLIYNGGEVVSWPLQPGVPGYTALKDLPAVDQELYSYDAAKAKKMIADAGYPNGFAMDLDIIASQVDLANTLSAMWAKMGVTVTINVRDSAVYATLRNALTYKDAITYAYPTANPFTAIGGIRSTIVGAIYKPSEGFDAKYNAAQQTVDVVAQTALIKQLAVDYLDDVGVLPFANYQSINCYWPWMKNYYGELESGYHSQKAMYERIWIDQDLKKSLGK